MAERKPWADEEIAILKKYYETEGGNVFERLKDRTKKSCCLKAQSLGLVCDKSNIKNKNAWTEEEDNYLREHFPDEGKKCFDKLTGRTLDSCYKRAENLGLTSKNWSGAGYWTEEEDKVLFEFYPKEGKAAFSRLPHRTRNACRGRCELLNLKTTASRQGAWSPEEDNLLRRVYPEMGRECYKLFDGRTADACASRPDLSVSLTLGSK